MFLPSNSVTQAYLLVEPRRCCACLQCVNSTVITTSRFCPFSLYLDVEFYAIAIRFLFDSFRLAFHAHLARFAYLLESGTFKMIVCKGLSYILLLSRLVTAS